MRTLLTICLLSLACNVLATDWAETSIKDPISGKDAKVWDIISFGGYIYQLPSKYDGVYWPYTAEPHIRFSPESGYIAFGSDFSQIDDDEKRRVSKFLKENYKKDAPPKTHDEKLDWLEKVYRARRATDEFWLRYHCVRAYRARSNKEASDPHRKNAVKIAEKLSKKLEPGFEGARVLFVLGSYSHMLGDAKKAEERFEKLSAMTWEQKDPEADSSEDIIKYFSRLADEIASDRYKLEYLPKKQPSG